MRILTFDLEEWFHILDHDLTRNEQQWRNFEYRLDQSIDQIIEVLDKHDQKATFFCLGWLTKDFSHIIKRLDTLGYEIATHSHLHQLVYEQRMEEFRSDLEYSMKSLEDITGKKITAYRAPGFSLKEENRWVFDILIENGIEIDCSIFPAKRDHGGFHRFGSDKPILIRANSGLIKEFPMSLDTFLMKKVVYGGGGYFRLLPYSFIRHMMRKSRYTMTYFHPHDFDPQKPYIPGLSRLKRFKVRVGLKGALRKLDRMLSEFTFVDLQEAVAQIDWDKTDIIELPERRKKQRLPQHKQKG